MAASCVDRQPRKMPRAASSIAWVLWLLIALCTSLAVTVGRSLDDYIHEDFAAGGAWLTLYDFFGGEEVGPHRLKGHLPWWSAPDLSLRFFRPLSSFFLALDHHVLDAGGLLSHLHGLLWYATVVVLAYFVLRRLVGTRAAKLSTAHYALANWHAFPLAFIAARHVHVTAVFALLTFDLSLRAVEGKTSHARWWALLVLGAGLFAGESVLLILPILLTVSLARHGARQTLRATFPLLILSLIYVVGYNALGYGANGSGLYLSPGSAQFFRQLPARWTALVADLVGSLANDTTMIGGAQLQLYWGLASLVAIASVLTAGLPHAPAEKRQLRALVLGAFVSLVAASAAMPGGRSLVIIGIAASAVFGSVATRCLADGHGLRPVRRRLLLTWTLVFGVGAHPVFRTLLPLDLRRLGEQVLSDARHLSEHCAGRVVLASGMLDPNAFYFTHALDSLGLPSPRAIHVLSMAPGRHELSQITDREYRLSIDGDFFASPWSRIQRGVPLSTGAQVHLLGVLVTVTGTQPTQLTLQLTEPDPVCWVTSAAGRPALFDPPKQWLPEPMVSAADTFAE